MQGFMPGFLSDHNYMQNAGSESDSNLLLDTDTDPSSPDDWAARAAAYETDLINELGPAGYNVQLLATEFNSVNTNPGKQTTSLVNGLFVADSLVRFWKRPTTVRTFGTSAMALAPATTIPPASMARATEVTTACSAARPIRPPRRALTSPIRHTLPKSSPRRSFKRAARSYRPPATTTT